MVHGMSCLKRLGKALASALLVVAVLAADAGAPRAQDGETAAVVFRDHISEPIIQSRCVNCHVEGGVSGHTRLVFVRSAETADHEALNLQTFEDLLDQVEDEGGGGYILNKIQGVSHGGGVQVPAGSADFVNMEWFLGLLGEGAASVAVALTPQTLFDTVVLAPDRKTLRRAALIFAGRIPTEAEYAVVEDGDASALRATIRGLMEGPQFHDFLIRGSNDRLLTDRRAERILNNTDPYFVDFVNEAYRRIKILYANGDEKSRRQFYLWYDTVEYGARRAPLELIAYVAENDLPYMEILTADYIMANPWAAAAYGASTQFHDPMDPYEFRPSRIAKYYRKGEGFESEYDPVLLATRVLEPGPLSTDYPHAGILNTTSFLHRYPTTATNRNRARARWTYYHFLGLDVEKSASRTTDPMALADTNNPTMHNRACTVCHSVLDPVAGAFQNYGDTGLYKDQWGGQDSLDEFYKDDAESALAIQAESWAERKSLTWRLSLAAGIQTLRVVFSNDFYDADTGDDGTIYLDRLEVRDADGQVLVGHEFEDLGPPIAPWGPCANTQYNPATGRYDHLRMWNGGHNCAFYVDVEVPGDGVYDVEMVAWAERYEQYGDGEDDFAELSVAVNAYEEGDTWYRDMRIPGFAGEEALHPDNSVQWLAQQIVADERFAEATVTFWWPAIMGSEVAEPPEDAADAGFEGQLLAANAQDAEVVRLADGFRDGFPGSPYTYNLKDLLVEIVLSKWFRADAVTDADPVRRVALHDAGARRLLTPEELARKTAVVTGVQWGRHTRSYISYQGSQANALTTDYRLLYGGIDSDGITERSRDITSVMAGVAQRNAVQVSCPVVMREFYLVPDTERRLFAGIDPDMTAADAIRTKLVELHDKLLGVQVAPDSPDVEAAYRLFMDVMGRGRESGEVRFDPYRCDFGHDEFFLEGILDGAVVQKEDEGGHWRYDTDWDRVNDFMRDIDFSDPHHAAQAWVVVLAAMLMDYRYLYL